MPSHWFKWPVGLMVTILVPVLAACGADEPAATPPPATATPVPPTATPTPSPQVPAFGVEAHFRGKTIRLVANSWAGGRADSQGRVMAAFIGKWIPGNPEVVSDNQPNKPEEYLFAATEAPKDGTYISWNSTPQLNFGFEDRTQHIKRSTFQFIGATIDSTLAWVTYDPVGNLGPSAASSCIWDYAGQSTTGGGKHGEFLLAVKTSRIADGNPTFLATVYASEQLDIPFRYLAFDSVDTNAVYAMWARGDINSMVRPSLWYRFPLEKPDWIPSGLIRAMAGMGPGELKGNAQTPEGPHCGDVRDHLDDEQTKTFNALMGPTNYMSKALWLPPGTPDQIADALSAAFERAFAEDTAMVQRYAGVAGETPLFTDRETGTKATAENEALYEESLAVVEREGKRLLAKYFPQYVRR